MGSVASGEIIYKILIKKEWTECDQNQVEISQNILFFMQGFIIRKVTICYNQKYASSIKL